jgi:hypothetical protein
MSRKRQPKGKKVAIKTINNKCNRKTNKPMTTKASSPVEELNTFTIKTKIQRLMMPMLKIKWKSRAKTLITKMRRQMMPHFMMKTQKTKTS